MTLQQDKVTDVGIQLGLGFGDAWVFNYKESLAPIKRRNKTRGEDNAVKQIEDFFFTIPIEGSPLYTLGLQSIWIKPGFG